jgi:hypothetical protein
MASTSSAPCPSSRESTNASFEGVVVHRLYACWVRGSHRGFLLIRGCWLEVDGRSGDIPRKNVWGNGDSPRRNFGELVCLLVVPAGHVIKLYAVERVYEGSYNIAVCLHLVIVTACILHDLVDHELRVPP